MSCVFFLVFVLVLTLSVCTSGAPRLPRQLQKTGEYKVFKWGQNRFLYMQDNGTVRLKPSRSHFCHDCEVDLQFLCQRKNVNVSGCPKRRLKPRPSDKLTTTLVMMQFRYVGKYLCMNRNATFYATTDPDANQLEECVFYVVNQVKTGRVLIYHFKYPEKKRNCRLTERRRGHKRKCVKYYLRKGNDNSLTVVKDKFFRESRWLPDRKDQGTQK